MRHYRVVGTIAVTTFLAMLAACSGGGGGGGGVGSRTYTIGGTVTGLGSNSMVVDLTTPAGSNGLTIYANGAYTFPGSFANGTNYTASMQIQPSGQQCTVANSSGTIDRANVVNVDVDCVATYTIGGTVTGLSGSGLVLQNNGGDSLAVSGNGAFTFATGLPAGTTYSITVSTQPTGPAQVCNVIGNSTGTMDSANISSMVIDCRSPRFAYVANAYEETISGYVIDPSTGRLRHNGYVFSADIGINRVTVDPTNRFLFVSLFTSNRVSAYSINATTGALTLVNSLTACTYPGVVSVDPAGKFLYVSCMGYNGSGAGVAAYTINSSTGALTSVGTYTAGSQPMSLAVSPDGQHLYVVNYNSSDISVFSIDGATGALMAVDANGAVAGTQATIATGTSPQAIAFDVLGNFAYVTSWNDSTISIYSMDTSNGALTAVGSPVSTGGWNADSMVFDPSGRYAYVTNYGSDNIAVFAVGQAGTLTAIDADDTTVGNQPTIPAGGYPNAISVDMTGKYLYAVSNYTNMVSVFNINPFNGALTPGRKTAARGGSGSITMANGASPVSYTPAYVYTANTNGGNTNGSVSGFGVNASSGALTAVSGSPFAAGMNVSGIATNPAGTRAYLANYAATEDGYSIGASGVLSALGGSPYAAPTNQWAYGIAVDPSNRFAYTANYNNAGTGGVSMYSINAGSGALTSMGAVVAGNGSIGIAADPSGRFVYVTNTSGMSLSGYSINPSTGALTQIDFDTVTAGVQDIGLGASTYPRGVAIDPTGRFVYVANSGNGTLAAFRIDSLSGRLVSAQSTITLGGATAVTVDPTGRWAYVTRTNGFNSVAVYAIDQATGVLTATGATAATGGTPYSVAVDASGRYLYVANYSTLYVAGNTVSVYSINSSDGSLTEVTGSPFAAGTNPIGIAATATMQ